MRSLDHAIARRDMAIVGPAGLAGRESACAPAAAGRPAIVHAAEQLCVQQGGTFTLSVDGERFTCMAAGDATFNRRDLLDGKTLCESSGDGTWAEVPGLWYTCELPA